MEGSELPITRAISANNKFTNNFLREKPEEGIAAMCGPQVKQGCMWELWKHEIRQIEEAPKWRKKCVNNNQTP